MGIFLFWHSWSLSCCCIGIEAALCARVNAGTSRRSWNSLLDQWHFILLWFIPIYVYFSFFSSFFNYVYDGYLFFSLEQLWILKVLKMEIKNNSSIIIINFFFLKCIHFRREMILFFSPQNQRTHSGLNMCAWLCECVSLLRWLMEGFEWRLMIFWCCFNRKMLKN